MSDSTLLKFKEILMMNKCHVTQSRVATFKLLDHTEPQSMRNILDRANGQLDRVSVYRNIELFEKLGIVNRISIGWKQKLELTDEFVTHHHHLSCLGCGNIIDIEDEEHINAFIEQVSERFGFKPVSHQFEVEGYCEACKVNDISPATITV